MKRTPILLALTVILLVACRVVEMPSPSPTALSTLAPQASAPPSTHGFCGDGVCNGPETPDLCPADCPPSPAIPPATVAEPTSVSAGEGVLYLGMMIHLEGWNDGEKRDAFERHAALLRDYADLFERYGARMTLESKEFTDGCINWGDNVLLEMEERGHGIGLHADVGGEPNYDCRRFAADLRERKARLESLGVTVRHASGIVSRCDWVAASSEAGFQFVTGIVAYGLVSMPPQMRPEPYRDCRGPAACHQPYPPDLRDRLHPWRMESGSNWTTPTPDGRLVILPAGGGLDCMAEESAATDSMTRCDFTPEDLEVFHQQLEEALSYATPDQVNIYYVAWSFGKALDRELLEAWLQEIQPYVESGRVEWKTLPEMYDAYIRWEAAQP